VLKTQICVTRPQCVKLREMGTFFPGAKRPGHVINLLLPSCAKD